MSFLTYKEFVEDGDTVIVFMGHNNMQHLQISQKAVFNTKFGCFQHSSLIGKRFGTKVYSKNKKGWIYLLHPTPELWTVTLPHRTQILYTTDISMVLLQLDLKPGSIVVESGTGSGSMSHAIIRTIAPSGHLYTFEFHEQRAESARSEFVEHGIADLVTVKHRDVIKDGFDVKNVADAVFLDLPSPWSAIKSAKDALKVTGGHICSFSPCIEQVHCTCDELEKQGFKDIRTMECLLRPYNIKTITFEQPRFGDSESENNPKELSLVSSGKRTHEDEIDTAKDEIDTANDNSHDQTQYHIERNTTKNKKVKIDRSAANNLEKIDIVTAKPSKQIPGHTGYLTFASLY